MRRLFVLCSVFFLVLSSPLAGAQSKAGSSATRAAAERLMATISLEKRVDTVVQLYLNFLPADTPDQKARAATLRERAPTAGTRFRSAVVHAAAASYTKPELDALDAYFASGEGQRLLTTAVTRAVLGLGGKGKVRSNDILRPEDLPQDNPALQAAASKYPAFEGSAKAELAREFAPEIALITAR